jgi:3',5'-cyclic AMP phosphodiesterase CpdA
MDGRSYYTFRRGDVRFFALESDYMTPEQLAWLEQELNAAGTSWKICFMHHPLYSTGVTHGPSLDLRRVLEPLLVRYHVDVVFAGHEHSYERFKPQQGVTYFVAGASAKLSRDNVRGGPDTAAQYDSGHSFMLVEIDGDSLWFRTIERSGNVVDAGLIAHANAE